MIQSNAKEEYLHAMRLGLREQKEAEAAGKPTAPAVLDELFPEAKQASVQDLPVQEIPIERIVGTKTAGRISAFSASFLPVQNAESEFAMKWISLCEAHLSDAGIREPISCYEYLGDFYVQEGNKRVSVLKYFGAVRIPAKIMRLLPTDRDDPKFAAYNEFLGFYRATRRYELQFRKPGDYAVLYSLLEKKQTEPWTDTEVRRLVSFFHYFKEAFASLGGIRQELYPEDALLLFLKVHPYAQACKMSTAELKKALSRLWGDVKSTAQPEAITVSTAPAEEKKPTAIGKLLSAARAPLHVAFLCQRDPDTSNWTKGHADGASYLAAALPDSVAVSCLFHADTPQQVEALLEQAVSDGAELLFTTAPAMLGATLKAAVKYPKLRFFNCSACQPLSSVKSYYCRVYEGKFITGLIAGALADNNLVGYIGSYPILGVPAAVNAFALGARMTNPRVKILLEWSCVDTNCVESLIAKGARVISNVDLPTPDASTLSHGAYGTFLVREDRGIVSLASPCWMWGKLYENIVGTVLGRSAETREQTVNYWWGMDSGVIDVLLTEHVPAGVRALVSLFAEQLKQGRLDVFAQKLTAQDGSPISDGVHPLSSIDTLKMSKLAEFVEGRIPAYDELLPIARPLVRELGIYKDSLLPEAPA